MNMHDVTIERMRAILSGYGPGILLSAAVALVSVWGETHSADLIGHPLPAAVLALVAGIFAHRLTHAASFGMGLNFCAKPLLQSAIALLGLRIVLDDIVSLGLQTVLIVSMAMVLTILCGIALARLLGRSDAYGALAGGATAVCGASAALAISTVIPDKERSDADTAFVVLTCNLLATLAMIAYPPLALWLGMDQREIGIFLGGSIHDVAQVVGAGMAVSAGVAGLATIIKIYRVFLLLPVVLGIGHFLRKQRRDDALHAKVPVPYFAFAFLALAALNSVGVIPETLRGLLLELSRWGLLLAIAALGLKTSLASLAALGVRHMVIMVILSAVIGLAVLMPILAFSTS